MSETNLGRKAHIMNNHLPTCLNVLIIEDNYDHVEIIKDAFHGIEDMPTNIEVASTIADGIQLLATTSTDICFVDLNFPDSDASETIKLLSEHEFAVPIVVLSSTHNTTVAKQLLNHGIQDFIPKNEISPELIDRTCRYAIERWRHLQTVAKHNNVMKVFCSSLSHDFNSHIARIIGLGEILEYKLDSRIGLSIEEKSWFNHLNSCSKEIHQLVGDLRAYLSVEYLTAKTNSIDLNDVIKEVQTTLEKTLKATFSVKKLQSLPNISGGHELLYLMFLNLFSNAIKFNENTPVITVTSKEDANSVSILVQDNGIGFDEAKAENIFFPFERLSNKKSYEGSGLGLSIVQRVMEHHSGQIKVKSTIGEGTCFILKFAKIR